MANMKLFQVTSLSFGAIGIVLFGVGLYTTYVVTFKLQVTEKECEDSHKGLWKRCVKECSKSHYNCDYYENHVQASTGLGIVAWVLAVVAMGSIGFVFSTIDLKRQMVYIGLSSVAYFLSGVCGLAGGIHFYVKEKGYLFDSPQSFYSVEIDPGWSLYVWLAGSIVFLLESTKNALFAHKIYRSL